MVDVFPLTEELEELEDIETVRLPEDPQSLAESAGHPWDGWPG